MTSLKTPPPDVLEYLQSVRATLADLPAEERDELMVDVETALLEASEEHEGPLAERLGPPEAFAADLRAAAGLDEPPAPALAPPPAPPRATAGERLREALAAAREDRRIAAVRRVAGDLAPIWWVARGLVAYAAVAVALGARMSVLHPSIPAVRDRPTTLVVMGLFVAASLWLGLRHRHARWMLAVSILLALIALPLAIHLASQDPSPSKTKLVRAFTRSGTGPRPIFSQGTINTAPPAAFIRPDGTMVVPRPQPVSPLGRATPVVPPAARTTPATPVSPSRARTTAEPPPAAAPDAKAP